MTEYHKHLDREWDILGWPIESGGGEQSQLRKLSPQLRNSKERGARGANEGKLWEGARATATAG